MSEVAGTLRKVDEQRLRIAAAALRRGGRFIIVVAEEPAWPAVKAALARDLSPSPFLDVRLSTGDDVMRTFASPTVESDAVVVLHIGEDAVAAMQTLNLHRDKLRKHRCRFLLRLDSPAAHERFVREAPDCYSVRDALAFIEGRPPPAVLQQDTERLEKLRRDMAEARDPENLLDSAVGLLGIARLDEAHRALDRGIATLEANKMLLPRQRATLAALHYYRGLGATREERHRHFRRALRILEPVRTQHATQYSQILGQLGDAYGIDVGAAREALMLARQSGLGDEQMMDMRGSLVEALSEHGGVKAAREALGQVLLPWWAPKATALALRDAEAGLLIEEGRWEEGERHLRESLVVSAQSGLESWFAEMALDLARLLAARGEIDAALDALAPLTSGDAESVRGHLRPHAGNAESVRVQLRRARAEPEAIVELDSPLVEELPEPEAAMYAVSRAEHKVPAIRLAITAGLLDPSRGEQLDGEIRALATAVPLLAPPWARIAAELLVADDLLARAGTEGSARAAAERAVALARLGAPELIPRCVRRIVVAALRAGQPDGLSALLDEASAAADAHHLPGEAARLAGLRLWLAARHGGDVAAAEQALQTAFERTGSVLLEAEVLYQVGRATGRRDLLERSRRIYRSLPWPEREAECLEAMGMKAAALARYEAFDLRLAALALQHREEPPPIGA